MLFSLIVFCSSGTYLSALCQVKVFGNHTNYVRHFVRFRVIQVLWSEDADTLVLQTVTEEIEISFAQRGMNFTFEPFLDVSYISNGGHFVLSASHSATGLLRANISRQTSLCRRPGLKCKENRCLVLPKQTRTSISLYKSSVDCNLFVSKIKYPELVSNCFLVHANSGINHVHHRSTVKNDVGQQIPRDLLLHDKCFAIGYCVLLSPVRRRVLVFDVGLGESLRRLCKP